MRGKESAGGRRVEPHGLFVLGSNWPQVTWALELTLPVSCTVTVAHQTAYVAHGCSQDGACVDPGGECQVASFCNSRWSVARLSGVHSGKDLRVGDCGRQHPVESCL